MENTQINKFVLEEKYEDIPIRSDRDKEHKKVDILPDNVDTERVMYNPRKECL